MKNNISFKSNKDPLISIITIVFNGEKYLEQTIKSVIEQSYTKIEYIIIDGGSSDGTVDILRKYDNRINYWISEKDDGISDAFNKGISVSKGDIIGFLNSDDFYEKDVLFNLSEFVKKQNLLKEKVPFIVHGKTYKIDLLNRKIKKNDNKIGWWMSVPFSHCSSFTSRSYIEKYGIFDKKFQIAMDVDFLMRGIHEALYINMNSYVATQREGGVSYFNRDLGYKEYRIITTKYYGVLLAFTGYFLKKFIVKIKLIKDGINKRNSFLFY